MSFSHSIDTKMGVFTGEDSLGDNFKPVCSKKPAATNQGPVHVPEAAKVFPQQWVISQCDNKGPS